MAHINYERETRAQSTCGGTNGRSPDEWQQASFFVPRHVWQLICVTLKLSEREAQISRLILCGYSEQAIAVELYISTHTVHCYLLRLYRKLQVSSRSKLVVVLFKSYVSLERPAVD